MADKKIIVEREALSSLSSHIREKSGSEATSLTWPQGFIDEIDNISTGVDVSGVTANAGDILNTATTFDSNGELVTGTIIPRTSTNRSITTSNQTETINAGYYPSNFTVNISSSAIADLLPQYILENHTILGVAGTLHLIVTDTTTDQDGHNILIIGGAS